METIALRDWIQIATLVFVAGVFVQQTRTTASKVTLHEARLANVETLARTTAALLAEATKTLNRVNERLDERERNSTCAEHSVLLQVFGDELKRLRDERE